ncbi:MAG: FHA domain-containing protein [Chloroflexi bacterium]|nr:FHA domain-containing protein [Chloroflexota bacterium]
MRRFIPLLTAICVLTIIVGGQITSQAQDSGPVVDILGKPDFDLNTPDIHAYVSVVDPGTGRIIDELNDGNFSVLVSEQPVGATPSLETTGVAVVIVIDRGGIASRGDQRIGQAVDLAESLLNLLNVDSTDSSDMVALIGIRGRDNGGLIPLVPFTDYDPNAVSNEFNGLRTEAVSEVTPLYDGIDQAIEWITDNPDADTREKLAHRRPIIVVFSDGIDKNFSDEARRIDIIDKCSDNDILLYSVRMGSGTTDAYNMEIMAERTNGLYVTHTGADDTEAPNLFENIVTQRQSYRVTFQLLRPQGDYQARIQVSETPIGAGSDETNVSSRLQPPGIALTSPADGETYTVPYSRTARIEIPLSVELTFPDGIERDPTAVRYYSNGVRVATSTAAPFEASWDITDIITQTEETRDTQEIKTEDFTFTAEADDAYLSQTVTSAPANVQAEWEPLPPSSLLEKVLKWLGANWWLLIILGAMALGMLVLLILLIRTRGEVARKIVARTTGVLKGVTQRLGAGPQRAPGKLVVIQGANMGKEFRLAAQVVKVGRDPQFCDFALYDEFASNPHFSVQLEQTRFYITDEGSTNGTRVNNAPLPPRKRILLQPDAIIEVGQTRLQFKRMGGTTRQLGAAQPGVTPPLGTPAVPPQQPPPQNQWTHPPTQPAPPHGAGQAPAQPGQQGGPTKQVRF